VVITGRVADPALFLAPLMHHFGWQPDDWQRMGQGICVGHLLECAAQVSGGYIADPGQVDIPAWPTVGFPLAEVQADGSRHHQAGGHRRPRGPADLHRPAAVRDRRPRSAICSPTWWRTSRRCACTSWARPRGGHAAPPARPGLTLLKATLGYRDGFIGEGQISYAGPGARARGELALPCWSTG
jgi:hypothetical protein